MLNPISSYYSSSLANVMIYDVFLNFRLDTRYGFAGNLYKALCHKGINAFMDDQELRMGDVLTPTIMKAIQQSRISIVIFSQDYASSTFCLEELVKIMECFNCKGMVVLPVFYKVDPSVVRHQIGSYGEALTKHEPRFIHDKDKVKKWKLALQEAANIIGRHVIMNQGYEHEHIEKIIQEVCRRINGSLVNYPVGLESPRHKGKSLVGNDHGDQVMSFVDVSSNDAAEIMSHVDAKSKNGAQVESRVGVRSIGGVRLQSHVSVNPTNGVHMEGISGNGNPTSGYTSGYSSNQNQLQGPFSVSQGQNSNKFQGSSSVSQGLNSTKFITNNSTPNQSLGQNSNGFGTYNSSLHQSQGVPLVSLGQNSNGFGTNNSSLNQSQALPPVSLGQNSNGFGTNNSSLNQSKGLPFLSLGQNSNGFGTYNSNLNQSQGPFVSQGQNSNGFGTYNYSTNQFQDSSFLGKKFS